jgi:HEAT repeat protein
MLRRAAGGSLDEVLALLADRHGDIRLAAARGLLARFPESAEALYPLLFDEAKVNVGTGKGCVPALWRPLGEFVLELLTLASAQEHTAVRSTLERALQDPRLGSTRHAHLFAASSRGVPRLRSAVAVALEGVHSGDPDVRSDASAMLGRAATLEELATVAADADAAVREAAAWALGCRTKSEGEARAWLVRLSQDLDRRVREAVARSLRVCASEPAAQAALARLAVDPDEGVREAAVAALGAARPVFGDLLVNAGEDASPRVRAAAVEGLLVADSERAVGLVLGIIEREECPPFCAAKALTKLAATGAPQVLAFARRFVAGCPDAMTPHEEKCMPVAISIIGAYGDPSDAAALRPHLDARFDEIARAAERALRRLSSGGR